MIQGMVGKVQAGDLQPVRLMGVINLSRESFYKGSVAGPDEALTLAQAMQEEGADLIDLGAVSTAPGSPAVGEALERERLFPVLKEVLDNLEIEVSVDTQRAGIADDAIKLGAGCINDVSGLQDPGMARTVANYDGSLIIMASRQRPGDLLNLDQIIPRLGERLRYAVEEGVSLSKISVDPGVGKWIPEKTPAHDLAILDGFQRLRSLDRPIVAALSRKSFIGATLGLPDPFQRLGGSLAATAIAVYLGAHLVRTHDVSASLDAVRMAQAIRGRPAKAKDDAIDAEVLGYLGRGEDLAQTFRRTQVDESGMGILCKKSSFRILAVRGLSSMEALIIKQEMLARGGDAAIPRLALRCDPRPEDVLIFGTVSQIAGLVKNLKGQPFRLSQVASAMQDALDRLDSPERYR
ncbi:MAG: dihydropteroate synthase [Methanothrix sp.]|nr:dihydropteroate synthase [Methanothrix sp.]